MLLNSAGATANELDARTEVYSQWLSRPEPRLDRSTGTFQETRLRYSHPVSSLYIDAGVFLLQEWVRDGNQSSVVSPYLGLRLPYRFTFEASTVSIEPFVQARARQPVGDQVGTRGWDPRTGLSVGAWSELGDLLFIERCFLDVYGDFVVAPRFSSSALGTLFARLGSRFFVSERTDWKFTSDIYSEFFHQEAASLDLGTRRTEARIGVAGSMDLKAAGVRDGSLQLRLYEGWPLRNDGESRPRFEALMVLGLTI